MSEQTFYWFDYETWGISPQWDRPSQFAGVRTDSDLNILGEPDMFYCQLTPDYLPDPGACLVTNLSPEFVNANGVPEHEFIKKVVALIGSKGTCSVGYNSIRFDDEVSRHTLFRNFHDPYQHEWKDGNSRWDLLDVVRLTRALRPEGINWPNKEDGSPNNKLEFLTAANNLSHDQAHDALSDVYATIAVAKLIKEAQPRLYDYALSLRDKHKVSTLLNWQEMEPVVHVSGMVPGSQEHTSIVVPLLRHPTNSNGIIVLDTRTDPDELNGLSEEDIRARLFNPSLSPNERLHLRTIQTNRCPMIAPLKTLSDQDAQRIGLDRLVSVQRASRAKVLTDETKDTIAKALTHQTTDQTLQRDQAIARCPEASLYSGGFLSSADRARADSIAKLSPDRLIGFEEAHGFFDDDRLKNLLLNYRARHAASSLTEAEREQWLEDCIERLNDNPDAVPWRTFEDFENLMFKTEWPPGSEMLQRVRIS